MSLESSVAHAPSSKPCGAERGLEPSSVSTGRAWTGRFVLLLSAISLSACTALRPVDERADAGQRDAGQRDAGPPDAGPPDAGTDSGTDSPDAGSDAGDRCAEVTCTSETTCSVGECDPTTGECVDAPRNEGGACDDESVCSWQDQCGSGACGGTVTDCDPGVLTFAAADTTPLAGGPASSLSNAADYDCPDGEVIVGVTLAVTSSSATPADQIARAQLTCARVSPIESSGGWVLQIEDSSVLPREGVFGDAAAGPEQTLRCPVGQVVAGYVVGQTGANHVAQLGLRCAPLVLAGEPTTGFSVTVGVPMDAGTVGAPPTVITDDTGPVDCPAGTVARGASVFADGVLDVLGLRCGTPTTHVITTAPLSGTTDGTLHQDDCPEGYLPTGLLFYPTGESPDLGLGHLQLTCSRVIVADDFTYELQGALRVPASGGRGNDPRYDSTAQPLRVTCPEGEVMVGLQSQSLVDGRPTDLAIQCAAMELSGDPEIRLEVGRGAVTTTELVGTMEGTVVHDPVTCPEGMMASGIYVRAGGLLEATAIRCAVPVFRPLVEVVLEPVADTYVCLSSPDTNYGEETSLRVVRMLGSQCSVLLRFDTASLSPASVVEYAALRMLAFDGYAYGNDGNVYTHLVLQEDENWVETAVNWDTRPREQPDRLGFWWLWYNSTDVERLGENVSPLLVAPVQDAVRGDDVISFSLSSPGYNTTYFSRETSDPTKRPQLVIGYYEP